MIWIAPSIAVIGLLVYALSPNPRVRRVGEIAYFCGLLAALLLFPMAMHLFK